MRAAVLTAFAVMIPALIGCKPANTTKIASEPQSNQATTIQIQLDVKQPEKSMGILSGGSDNLLLQWDTENMASLVKTHPSVKG